MPTHWPLPLKAGPPELPELIAESVWMPNSSAVPCTYDVTSILETTPLVTDKVSPPIGYLRVTIYPSHIASLNCEPDNPSGKAFLVVYDSRHAQSHGCMLSHQKHVDGSRHLGP